MCRRITPFFCRGGIRVDLSIYAQNHAYTTPQCTTCCACCFGHYPSSSCGGFLPLLLAPPLLSHSCTRISPLHLPPTTHPSQLQLWLFPHISPNCRVSRIDHTTTTTTAAITNTTTITTTTNTTTITTTTTSTRHAGAGSDTSKCYGVSSISSS